MIEFHGNLHFQNANSFSTKLFWAITVCAATAGATYFTVVTINRYLLNPTAFSISFHSEVGAELPDVLFCSSDIFDKDKLESQNVSKPIVDYLEKYFAYSMSSNVGFNGKMFKKMFDHNHIDKQLKLVLNGSDFEQFILNLGPECESFLIGCTVETHEFNCCDIAVPISHNGFGKCFALKNLSQTRMQTSPGKLQV